MSRIVNTVGLVVLWIALVGEFSVKSFLGGVAAALLVAIFSRVDVLGRPHKTTVPGLLGFSLIYVAELLVANLRIARMIVAPHRRIRTAMYVVPTEADAELELFLLSNLNTFTPGSVVVGVEEGAFLVHAAGVDETGQIRDAVMDNERRVLWFIR